MSQLRLVKVVVQPFLVLDDGETITEIEHPAVVIPASEWPTYSSERFPREIAEWQTRIDAEAPEGIVQDDLLAMHMFIMRYRRVCMQTRAAPPWPHALLAPNAPGSRMPRCVMSSTPV